MVSFLTQTKETHFLCSYSKIPLLIAREDFIPLLFHNPRASVSFKRKILTLSVWERKQRAQVVVSSVNQSYTAQVLFLFLFSPVVSFQHLLILWSILVSSCTKASQLSGDEGLHFSCTSHPPIKPFGGSFVSCASLEMRK